MYQKIKYDHESAELDAWKNLYGYWDYIVTGTVFFPWPLNLSLQPQFKCLVGFELCQKVFEREKVTLNECRPKRNKIGRFKTAREQFHDNKRDSKFNL